MDEIYDSTDVISPANNISTVGSDTVQLVPPKTGSYLPLWRRIAFGFGHVYNDLCASMWFSYLLVFCRKVLLLSGPTAGFIFLIGQIADALATPIVGFESDRKDANRTCLRYGRRKMLHLIGTVSVFASFTFLFMKCFGCTYGATGATPDWIQVVYYAPFVVIFQFGWASVQIGHLALLPELTPDKDERATLNGIRYAFTVVASIVAFGFVYLFVGQDVVNSDVTPADANGFRAVALVVTGVGLVFSVLFHLGVKERMVVSQFYRQIEQQNNGDGSPAIVTQMTLTWRHWMKNSQFYLISLLYMLIRLFNNVTMTYLPLYVLETQQLNKVYIATVPLGAYVSSFFTSTLFSFRSVTKFCDRKVSTLLGILIGFAACGWMWDHQMGMMIFGVSVLLGVSSAILIINALALTTDLIDDNTESGAFVFGTISFFDKMLTGIGVQIIQAVEPYCGDLICQKCNMYFKYVMVCVPSCALLLALVALCILWFQQISNRRRNQESDDQF